jgi:hypothetical protein
MTKYNGANQSLSSALSVDGTARVSDYQTNRIDDKEYRLVSSTVRTHGYSHVTVTFLIWPDQGGRVTPPCELVGSIHPRAMRSLAAQFAGPGRHGLKRVRRRRI